MINGKTMAQRRTGRSKKFTMIWSNDYIVKGPYSDDNLIKLWNRYVDIFKAKVEFITPMLGQYINRKLRYAVFENVGIEYKSHTIRNKESFTDLEYDIIDSTRSNVKKLSDDQKFFESLSDDIYNRLIASLIKLYIIGVGDTGFYNTIFNKNTKQIYIIDVEENRDQRKTPEGKFFFLSRPPRKNMQRPYDPEIVYKIISKDMGENETIKRLLLGKSETKVVNCAVKYIRPEYENLKEWSRNPNNVYIGRSSVFIDGKRFPQKHSIWHNPFSVKKYTREESLKKYREYITDKLSKDSNLRTQLKELKGKNLGCWCYPLPCHGDILVELINS